MIVCSNCNINFIQRKSELIKDVDGTHICTDCHNHKVDKNHATYFLGGKNKAIRYYFYSQRGLALLNEGRYLIMGVFALYYTLKLTNPLMLVGMFAIAIPLLITIGWFSVNHVGKVVDYLNIKYSTHYGKLQFTLLEEIRDAVKAKNCNCSNS